MNSKLSLFIAGGVFLPLAVSAQTLVTSLAGLGATDHLDWGTVGAENAIISTPINVNSVGGVPLNISSGSGGNFHRVDQGTSWFGNFASGTHLLWTVDAGPTTSTGPIQINLNSGIYGLGLEIAGDTSGAFTAQIQAYSGPGGSTYLGAWTENGNGSATPPTFIGIQDSTPDITSVIISLTATSGGTALTDFTVGTLQLQTAVPEPAAQALGASLGLLALAAWRRTRR